MMRPGKRSCGERRNVKRTVRTLRTENPSARKAGKEEKMNFYDKKIRRIISIIIIGIVAAMIITMVVPYIV